MEAEEHTGPMRAGPRWNGVGFDAETFAKRAANAKTPDNESRKAMERISQAFLKKKANKAMEGPRPRAGGKEGLKPLLA